MNGTSSARILAAEAIGTLILVLGGPGTAVLAAGSGALDGAGVLGVSLAFGFALLVAAYAIGPISGCHINPAVTIGLAVMRKVHVRLVPVYVVGQLIGAAIGGLIILILAKGLFDDFDANAENFATNLWSGPFAGFGAMVLAEIVFTAMLVFVVLSTMGRGFTASAGGLTVGITLALIHLISIPIDNTSVNPARSFAMAIYAGGDALEQLWAFVVFPIIGAVVGVLAWLAVDDSALEDTMLANKATTSARDAAAKAGGAVTGAADRLGDALD
jgi:aquaporin Z